MTSAKNNRLMALYYTKACGRIPRMTIKDIPAVDRALKKEFKAHAAPIIELIEAQTHDPFCVLVGTILSARTKDACTAGAVKRLFATAEKRRPRRFTPDDLRRLSVAKLDSPKRHPVNAWRALIGSHGFVGAFQHVLPQQLPVQAVESELWLLLCLP